MLISRRRNRSHYTLPNSDKFVFNNFSAKFTRWVCGIYMAYNMTTEKFLKKWWNLFHSITDIIYWQYSIRASWNFIFHKHHFAVFNTHNITLDICDIIEMCVSTSSTASWQIRNSHSHVPNIQIDFDFSTCLLASACVLISDASQAQTRQFWIFFHSLLKEGCRFSFPHAHPHGDINDKLNITHTHWISSNFFAIHEGLQKQQRNSILVVMCCDTSSTMASLDVNWI